MLGAADVLNSCRGVHRVAEHDDLALPVTHLTDDQHSSVNGAAQLRLGAELAEIVPAAGRAASVLRSRSRTGKRQW
jgi:hypothetical protein